MENVQRTQDIEPILMLNSAFFIFNFETAQQEKRFGKNTYYLEMNTLESIDIDYEYEYNIAKFLSENNITT